MEISPWELPDIDFFLELTFHINKTFAVTTH